MDQYSPEQKMLLIRVLDDNANIRFSDFTGRWYVESHVWIGDGAVLRGITEHERTPYEAVNAIFEELISVDWPTHYLVTENPRRRWRWNGAAFVEIPTLMPYPEPS